MSNQWKMVPVEPTDEMNKAGMRWLTGIQHMRAGDKRNALNEAFKAMSDSAPVPPAGDVEVLLDGVFDEMSRRFELSGYDDERMVIDDTQIGVEFAIEALRPVLGRVTAERDGLLAEVKRLDLEVSEYDYAFDSQQSELTKARELVLKLANAGSQASGFPSQLMRDARIYLTHQSAPAAKGGE